jgi:hypothetical protein
MTVQDLISLLQEFPGDLPVRFSAEMGSIETSTPRIEVEEADVDENWQQTVLLIDLDG